VAAAGLAPGLAAQGTARLVLTREELLAGGVARPSDVLRLAIGWGAATVDQVTWAATADWLPATGSAAALSRDGRCWSTGIRSPRSCSTRAPWTVLPIVPGQLDSVVVVRAPSLVPAGSRRAAPSTSTPAERRTASRRARSG
jgi:hypothetical protein